MDRGSYSGGWGGDFGDQYDPTEYNMGAAASARMHTVLDSSGTRLFVFFFVLKKKGKKSLRLSPVTANSNHKDNNFS